MPSYSMQTVHLLGPTCEDIEKKARDFLWGSSDEHKRMHLVAWNQFCSEKRVGGLGMKHLKQQNKAFMMKLGWGLIKDRNLLWARVIRAKYGCGNDLLPEINPKKQGSNMWTGIKKAWEKTKEGIQRVRDPTGSEQARWKWEKSRSFTVRSAYRALSSDNIEPEVRWRYIWKSKIPQRCKAFTLLMMQERLITNKLKWRRNQQNDGFCGRCHNEVEDVLHALRDCIDSRKVWESIIIPRQHQNFFSCNIKDWFSLNMRKKLGIGVDYWKGIFIIIRW